LQFGRDLYRSTPGWSANRKLTYDALWLGKKSRLRPRVFRVAKVAQAHAHQAEPLLRPEADALPQRQGDFRQFLAGRRWGIWRVAASEDLKFAGLQFQYDGAGDS